MQKQKRLRDQERKFFANESERRQRKHNSLPVAVCQPAGDEHAGGRNVSAEGMEASPGEIAAAGFSLASK
jgi:hypothetical protein